MAQSVWVIDKDHSKIGFSVEHLGGIGDVEGQFNEYQGTVYADSDDLKNLRVSFVMEAKSIDTYNEQRDDHLRSVDFLDADVYPTIVFESTAYKQLDDRKFRLIGDVTLHGVTKEVSFEVRYRGVAQDMFGNMRAGFRVSGEVNRKDFGITWNRFLDTGGVLVGEEIRLLCHIELIKRS
ncbi:MAG: YceI family protein [Bacteroidota bacterium]|nr:YceI family protein [Candidatus Kapabacteria bacterium]MDW8219683.1 YceI family protein [Bacteroidota bacterium]